MEDLSPRLRKSGDQFCGSYIRSSGQSCKGKEGKEDARSAVRAVDVTWVSFDVLPEA